MPSSDHGPSCHINGPNVTAVGAGDIDPALHHVHPNTRSQVNPRHRNRWHNGLLAGTASILVCVDGDSCFAGLVNSRGRDDDSIVGELDRLMWDIYGQVIG